MPEEKVTGTTLSPQATSATDGDVASHNRKLRSAEKDPERTRHDGVKPVGFAARGNNFPHPLNSSESNGMVNPLKGAVAKLVKDEEQGEAIEAQDETDNARAMRLHEQQGFRL